MIPRVFRVEAANGSCSWSWWMVADGRGVLTGIPGEHRPALLARWQEVYGVSAGGFLNVADPITPDQVGDTLDQLRTAAQLVTAEGGGA